MELERGTSVGTNAGLPVREIVAGGDTPGLTNSGACAGSEGDASSGSRYELIHEYEHYSLAKTYLFGYPNWYRADIDRNTGLPSATYNPQDQKTTHNFDRLGRLTSSVPEASLAAANLIITYKNPPNDEANITETQKQGGTVLTWQRSKYDAFGRLIDERRRRSTSGTTYAESKRIQGYDLAGLLRRVSTSQNTSGFDRDKAAPSRWLADSAG